MKRVIAVSDSHGCASALREAFELAWRSGPVDVAVFLGDGLSDYARLEGELIARGALCYAVRGNNDWSASQPREVSFTVGGVRFYACHGHEWHVKYGWIAYGTRRASAARRWRCTAIRTARMWSWSAACIWSIPARYAKSIAGAPPTRISAWRITAACAWRCKGGSKAAGLIDASGHALPRLAWFYKGLLRIFSLRQALFS